MLCNETMGHLSPLFCSNTHSTNPFNSHKVKRSDQIPSYGENIQLILDILLKEIRIIKR